MALPKQAFSPTDGFANTSSYPNPTTGAINRAQRMTLHTQMQTYINDTLTEALESTTDGSSGADNIGATAIPALGSENTVQSQLEKIVALGVGVLPGNDVITDAMLKQTGNNVLPRTSAHIANTSNPHGTTISQVGGSNFNLFHNWNFKDVINQRGQSSYSTTNALSVDRWMNYGANNTISIISGGIRIANTMVGDSNLITQVVSSYLNYSGKTITYSINCKGLTLNGATLRMAVSDGISYVEKEISQTGVTNMQFTVNSSPTILRCVLVKYGTQSISIDLESVKLEGGVVSTLSNDTFSDYPNQLSICQRYAVSLTGQYRMSYYTANTIIFTIPLPTTPRIAGTLESGTYTVKTTAAVSQSGFTFSYVASSNALIVTATKTSHGLTDAILDASSVIMSFDL